MRQLRDDSHRALKEQLPDMGLIERRKTIEVAALDAAPLLRERPDRRNIRDRDALARRLQGEFRETPGLCLTAVEASRLFGIAPGTCKRVLTALVDDGLLDLRGDGRYMYRS